MADKVLCVKFYMHLFLIIFIRNLIYRRFDAFTFVVVGLGEDISFCIYVRNYKLKMLMIHRDLTVFSYAAGI